MTTEQAPAPLRNIDMDQMRKDMQAFDDRKLALKDAGQILMARLRPSSKYHHQTEPGELFQVCVSHVAEYCVHAYFGQEYRLCDVDLFVVFDESRPPKQLTFE